MKLLLEEPRHRSRHVAFFFSLSSLLYLPPRGEGDEKEIVLLVTNQVYK